MNHKVCEGSSPYEDFIVISTLDVKITERYVNILRMENINTQSEIKPTPILINVQQYFTIDVDCHTINQFYMLIMVEKFRTDYVLIDPQNSTVLGFLSFQISDRNISLVDLDIRSVDITKVV